MKLVSFDTFRTLNFPGITQLKPEHFLQHRNTLESADWVIFPEYWQISTLIFGLKRRIFPSLSSYLLGHNKVEMTRAFLAVAPENVPHTLIEVNEPVAAERVWQGMTIPFVAKIPKSSMGEGVFLIETRQDWTSYLNKTPVIYAQEYLPINKDLRIVIVGDCVIGGFWRLQANQGFYNNLARGGEVDHSPIPAQAIELARRLAQALEINHAGFDIAMVGSHPYVLEFNRLFGNRGLGEKNKLITPAILEYLQRQSNRDDPNNPMRPSPILPIAV